MEQFFMHLAANPYFAACAGLSVGAGIIIIFLSKYGTRIFFPGGTSMETNSLTRVEKKIDSVDTKVDSWMQQHVLCRDRQREEFATKKELEEWKGGRDPLWVRINHHEHDAKGRVIITEV